MAGAADQPQQTAARGRVPGPGRPADHARRGARLDGRRAALPGPAGAVRLGPRHARPHRRDAGGDGPGAARASWARSRTTRRNCSPWWRCRPTAWTGCRSARACSPSSSTGPTTPGNIGTLIRSADAFGASAVIITGHAADPYDPKAVRASTGSLFAVPVIRADSHREVLDWVGRAARRTACRCEIVGTDEHGAGGCGGLRPDRPAGAGDRQRDARAQRRAGGRPPTRWSASRSPARRVR